MRLPKLYRALLLIVIPVALLLSMLRTDVWLLAIIGMGLLCLLLMITLWATKKINPAPVPDQAVRQLLDSIASNEEWILVKFRPGVSLEEARRRVGSEAYSEEERLMGFMTKLRFMAETAPSVAIFYSAEKGFVCGRRAVITAMLDQYGRWMLDTWFTLDGALRKNGFQVHSLDGPQFVSTRRLFRQI